MAARPFPMPRAKAPPPQHVLQANGGDDPADDDSTINASAPDEDEATPDVPGGPMALPATPGPRQAPNGSSISSLPSGQGNVSIPDLVNQITTNLTPQELAELDSMISPRLAQLAAQALPMLTPVLQAFMQAEQNQGPTDPNTADLAQDADALSMTGSQQQYQANYGSPTPTGPEGPPNAPAPTPDMMRRARGPLGMVSGG